MRINKTHKKKLATIGTSPITDKFLSGVKRSGKFELAAVYSRNAKTGKEFSDKYGKVPVFTDLTKMAKSGIDAVYIASPNICHYEQSKLFLENGVNVICEKPITCSLKQYNELKEIADKNDLIYLEAIMSMYSPGYDTLHKSIKKIGKISVARIDFGQRSSRLDEFCRGVHQNIFDMSLYAGTLMDLGVYCVYCAVDLFGVPLSIISKSHYLSNGCDSSGVSIFDYGSFSAVLTYGKTGQSQINSEIIGENGTVIIKSISQYAGIKLIVNGREELYCPTPERSVIMRGEIDAFADFLERKNIKLYDDNSAVCKSVHSCMDEIKLKAGIKYE